jgi:hypothetical protein
MGRQTQFHMLADDCKQFLRFVQERDPVIVVRRSSQLAGIEEVHEPWQRGGGYCLWNQALLPSLERKYITESDHGPYYRVDSALPVIEFSYPLPIQEPWNGKPALTQGRVWAGFEHENRDFERWYNAVVRWIRKNFTRNPVPLDGYVGSAAYDWYKKGGVFLPMLRPPITPQWLSWVEAQDQHRAVFSK